MPNTKIPWLLISLTLFLIVAPVLLLEIVFPYAETTKSPDLIEDPLWFISGGLILLGLLLAPITIALTIARQLSKRNQQTDAIIHTEF